MKTLYTQFYKLFAVALFVGCSFSGMAQGWSWATQGGGADKDAGNNVCMDATGNTIVVGYFSGSATFGKTILVSTGSTDIFIAKYSSSGAFLWAVKAGGTDGDEATAVATDGSDNIYVTGSFSGTSADFGKLTVNGTGGTDFFVAKFDSYGAAIWVTTTNGADNERGNDIQSDALGQLSIIGEFSGTASFGGLFKYQAVGGTDIFVAACDPSGTLTWVSAAGGKGDDWGMGIAVDGGNNCYVTGSFTSAADFGSINVTGSAFDNLFLAQYDTKGNASWVSVASGNSYVVPLDIQCNAKGGTYITGYYDGTIALGGQKFAAVAGNDIFIVRYDYTGNVIWANTAGGKGADNGKSIAIDGSGNCYIAGSFESQADFGSYTAKGTGKEIYVAKYDTYGNPVGVVSAGGAGDDNATGIAADASGNVSVTGSFEQIAAFGSTNLTSTGNNDIFIAQVSIVTQVAATEIFSNEMDVYPNPSLGHATILCPAGQLSLEVYNALGEKVISYEGAVANGRYNFTPGKPGVYYVKMQQGDKVARMQLVVLE